MVGSDLVGHEYSHGVNAFVLTYQGESGALAENHSDVTGEMFEYGRSGSNDWVMGAGLPGDLARSLIDPPSLNNPYTGTPYPDHYTSDDVYCGSQDNYGVHINSTIPSKAHYLATMGGQFNGCSITGIGREKVEQILYESVVHHYAGNETFSQAYNDQIQTCSDLIGEFGITLADCQEVVKALQSVELNQVGKCQDPNHEQRHQPYGCLCEKSDDLLGLGQLSPFTKGTMQDHNIGKVASDSCRPLDGNTLGEYTCIEGHGRYDILDCASLGNYICDDGACVAPSCNLNGVCEWTENVTSCPADCDIDGQIVSCEDSDSSPNWPDGLDPYTIGMVTLTVQGGGHVYSPNDYCEDGQQLVEFFCTANNRIGAFKNNCVDQHGSCIDGACVVMP